MQEDAGKGDTVIAVRELTKVFGRFTAVDRLSFGVGRGEIFGFLGPNGAGKSTTIRMLCGLLSSTSGTASVDGFDINREPEQVRLHIGYMSQKFSLYKDLTVMENLTFFGGVYGVSGRRLAERTDEVIMTARLGDFRDKLAGHLSGAVQQRLALACAVLHEPPVLFLDEPTSGVDPISRRAFWDLIQNMAAAGVTVLVTTHFIDEAEFCRRVGLINGGRLVALDTPRGLKTSSVPEDLFEVTLPFARGVRESIGSIDGVLSVSFFGQSLHVFCRKDEYTAERLESVVRDRGVAARSVRRIPATLEDAFMRLIQAQPGERAA